MVLSIATAALLLVIALGVAGVDFTSPFRTEVLPASVRLIDAATVDHLPSLAPPGQPVFLASNARGELAASDRTNKRILRFDANGQATGTWGPRLAPGVEVTELGGIASAGDGWVALDRGEQKVYQLDSTGQLTGTIDLHTLGTYGPNGLATDTAGRLFMADTGQNRLLMFGPDGHYIRAIASAGTGIGELKQPMSLAAGPDGAVYVADWENQRIERFDASQRATDAWQTASRPWGVSVDRTGRVYVPDADHRTLQVFSSGGTALAELGTQGGPTIDVDFPTGVATGADDNTLWVLGSQGLARLRLEPLPETAGQKTRIDVPGLLTVGGLILLICAAASATWIGRRRLIIQAQHIRGRLAEAAAASRTTSLAAEPRRARRAAVPITLSSQARGLVIVGVLLAVIGQWVLVALPRVPIPNWLDQAVAPVWPDTGPAVVATALFVLAMVFFGSGIALGRREPEEVGADWPALDVAACWSPLSAALFAVGSIACLAIAVLLALTLYVPIYPMLFATGALLTVVGLAWRERRRLPRPNVSRAVAFEMLYVVIAMAVFTWLASFDLGNWYYSSIGDEQAFYGMARDFAQGGTIRNLFSQSGVYEYHPVLTSFIDGMFMRVIGTNGVGWKIANNVLVVACLPLLYVLARANFSRRVAVLSVGLLATAHYLLAFAHTGYNSLEPLFYTLAAMLCFLSGLRRGSLLLLILAGMFAGLGWYTFYTSRAVIVILLIALPLMVPRSRWVSSGVPLLVGFALLFLPFLAANGSDLVTQMLRQSTVGSGEVVANRTLLPYWNTGRSLLAFNYNTYNSLYTSGSLAEPLTGALFVLGLAYLIATWRDARSRLLLVWYGIGLFATGIASQYDHVTISRLHFLLPLVVLTAALAADRWIAALNTTRAGRLDYTFSGVFVVVLIFGASASNLYRWFVVSPLRTPSSPTALTMEVLEQPVCQNAPRPALVIDREEGGALNGALAAGPPLNPPDLVLYQNAAPLLSTTESRCTIFRNPTDAGAVAVIDQLESLRPDVQPTPVKDQTGTVIIYLFYPSATASASPAQPNPTPVTPQQAVALQELSDAHGIATDSRGVVYVADTGHQRVVAFDTAGHATLQISPPDGSDGALQEPFKVAVDSNDRLYVLDGSAANIKRFSASGAYQTTLLQDQGMYSPRGLYIDSSDQLWVADTGHNRILQATADGRLLREWNQIGGQDLDQPTSVAADGAGGVYIAEPEDSILIHANADAKTIGSHPITRADTRSGPDLLPLNSGRLLMTDLQRGVLEVLDGNLQNATDWHPSVGFAGRPAAIAATRTGEIWLVDDGIEAPLKVGVAPQ